MVLKKVFEKTKKYFYNNEKYELCIYCRKKLVGSQRKFCSDKCNSTYWREVYAGIRDRNKINIPKANKFEYKIRKMKKKDLIDTVLKGGLCKKCKKNLAQ